MSRRAASQAVVAARSAVASSIADLPPGDRVLVACSGGADSLALAGALAWVAARAGLLAEAVVVDHALQPDSDQVARTAAEVCTVLGIGDVRVMRVQVGRNGGPEAAARDARYAALEAAAVEGDASTILLGHTREDQAETVLLRLARGSGARSLSAMRPRSGPWRRPFLALPREVVRSAALEMLAPHGRQPWEDPHNDDPVYSRVRVRRLLGDLTTAIGPGAVAGLTRTADLLRDDADLLDDLSDDAFARLVTLSDGGLVTDCDELLRLPRAVRTRLIRSMCRRCGCLAEDLSIDHIHAVEALVTDWRGQGPTSLPGGVLAERAYGRLCLRPPA